MSSSTDALQDDPLKARYRQLKAVHRSRLHIIMSGQDRHSQQTVVLKTFQKSRLSSTAQAKLEAELQTLKLLSGSPGIVKFVNYVEDDDNCYIVMERCPGATLIEAVANSGGRLQERTLVVEVLIPLLECLASLHSHGIVHRQLKPEHIMVGRGSLHVLDFAEAVDKTQRCLNNRAGAMEYMAPEVLAKPTAEEVFHQVLYNGMSEEELPQYDEKADVWSLGAITFEALTGCQPFLADSIDDMIRVQQEALANSDEHGMPHILLGHSLSAEAADFLQLTLQPDPAQRPSAQVLLQHPLVQRYFTVYLTRQHAAAAAAAMASGEPMADDSDSKLQQAVAASHVCAPEPIANSRGNILVATPIQFAVR